MNKPRDAIIAEHIAVAMRHTRLSYEAFAQSVLDHYHATTTDTLRTIKFHPVPQTDPYPAMRANAQLVRRMVEGTAVRMPVEIEESLVLSLPAPHRDACLRELSARYGLLAAPMPTAAAEGQAGSVGALLHRCGESIKALAPMLEDGAITAADANLAPAALAELQGLQSLVTTIASCIKQYAASGATVTPLRRA
ncbi:MAG TPA: hypothetical protein PLR28_09670 [Dokdonella sp.]|nr:hypothetical protein [Dokdonella sp.]